MGKLYCLGSPDTKMLKIKSTTPAQDETGVPVSGNINIEFNEPIQLSSIDVKNVMVKNSKNESAKINVEYDDQPVRGFASIHRKNFVPSH